MGFVREECSKQRNQQVQKPCSRCVLGGFGDSKEARIWDIDWLRRGVGDEVKETMAGSEHSVPRRPLRSTGSFCE